MKTLEERFWEKVDCSGDCWRWTGAKAGRGYGVFRKDGKMEYAHRVSYAWANGEIESGLDLDHLCREITCVNPSHLEPVSRRENLLRGETIPAQHASKTHCPKGHPYSGSNLYMDGGSRKCRTCKAAKDKAYRERKKNLQKKV